jgi:hypothetical protein
MAAGLGAHSSEALFHPAFEPLRPWLDRVGPSSGLEDLNRLAAISSRPPVTAAGKAVRFCTPQSPSTGHYERTILDTGRVDTRADNLHDFFNALVWLAFPKTKAAINARHVERLDIEGPVRGSLRDLLTLFDEGGVIVTCPEQSLGEIEALVRQFRWQELFWDRREQVLRDVRFMFIGHNAYEKALVPYPGITCKALFIPAPAQAVTTDSSQVEWLDTKAADWVLTLPDDAKPRSMAPLPVFGYPGWLAGSANADFYANRRWFRPGRMPFLQGKSLSGRPNSV